MTIGEVLRLSTGYLERKGVESPRLDAELLLAHALGLSRIELYTQHDRPLGEPERDVARALLERRGAREPLAYVLGSWGFRRLTLATDARALVPRPETEVLVERCLALLAGVAEPRILDVGTGTGAIALALADELPGARVTALDRSPDAIALAREDGRESSVTFVEGDYRAGLPDGPYDLVVSNPPYVLPEEIDALEPEVRDWEPREALVSADGPEAVARAALGVLAPGGALALEVGDAPRVAAALVELRYEEVRIEPDLSGRERIVEGRRP
ncbi:MAG: peptide chain release factor N(5)-glutamine methyltransferase [Gaiellaceae bacterium]